MAGCNMLLCKYFAWGETGELRFHAGATWERGGKCAGESKVQLGENDNVFVFSTGWY